VTCITQAIAEQSAPPHSPHPELHTQQQEVQRPRTQQEVLTITKLVACCLHATAAHGQAGVLIPLPICAANGAHFKGAALAALESGGWWGSDCHWRRELLRAH